MEISKRNSSEVSKCLGARGGSEREEEDELQLGGRVRPPLAWQGPVGSHSQLTPGTPSEWLPDGESSHPRDWLSGDALSRLAVGRGRSGRILVRRQGNHRWVFGLGLNCFLSFIF